MLNSDTVFSSVRHPFLPLFGGLSFQILLSRYRTVITTHGPKVDELETDLLDLNQNVNALKEKVSCLHFLYIRSAGICWSGNVSAFTKILMESLISARKTFDHVWGIKCHLPVLTVRDPSQRKLPFPCFKSSEGADSEWGYPQMASRVGTASWYSALPISREVRNRCPGRRDNNSHIR